MLDDPLHCLLQVGGACEMQRSRGPVPAELKVLSTGQ